MYDNVHKTLRTLSYIYNYYTDKYRIKISTRRKRKLGFAVPFVYINNHGSRGGRGTHKHRRGKRNE